MKFTLNIDDALLERVMKSTGAKTKTEAIHAALAEVDRRHKLIALLSEDIGKINWDNAIDASAWEEGDVAKVAESPTSAIAVPTAKRKPVRYDSKPRPRR